jgi:hemoglobin-like flavoprotein
MIMNAKQIQIIRQSFSLISPTPDAVAAAFYGRLFAMDPSLRSMFPPCLEEQGRRLMRMLGVAIGMLDRSDELVSALRSLGRRHVAYGVRDEHYETVGAALLWTLEHGLGWAFTPEVREAWTALYGVVATMMQEGAKGSEVPLQLRTSC